MNTLKRWVKNNSIETFLLILVSVIFFVYSLGFITNFYPMFYLGTNEMFETYKSLQNLNKYLFNAALNFIVLAFLTIPMGIVKRKTGIINSVYLLGFSIYAFSIFNEVRYYGNIYKNEYLSHDFSSIDGYVPSTFEFDLGNLLLISIVILAAISFITTLYKFILERRAAKGVVELYGS